ncbi:molybdenum ABC transporter ATP-binding protein [Halomonas sp. PAMB 3232]|uniref:molybdenum ABC transporter ATP-binding protein n=1 Tax=Halomonas sp. PAMB 3232 TaxID=3075221 RepID=UPI002899E454|nr:molybdenum ABC transporter ATP-binding protein [Halomonas sp. PAMB 3232]WNL38070.1 molybdenum ABC transporter ATP-binding protein [Halomonas sp. PAMB 3232]
MPTEPSPPATGLSLELEQRLGAFQLSAALDLPGAGVTGVFGPSGSGKTSLLRLIAGLERPNTGRIQLGERVLVDSAKRIFVPPHQRRLGVVFQEARLFPHYRVRGNLTYAMPAHAAPRFDDLVELLGIGHLLERMPGALSGGEARRVAIGRALLSDPQMLLMDEPLTGLDGARKQELLRYIATLTRQVDIPVVYVSHDADEIAAIADHLVVMGAGQVVASDTLCALLQRLDLTETLKAFEAASLLEATIVDHDAAYGLTQVVIDSGASHDFPSLTIPAPALAKGQRVRLHVKARDVSLDRSIAPSTSELDALPAVIEAMTRLPQTPHQIEVRLRVGTQTLRAQLTRKACDALALEESMAVTALIRRVTLSPI